MIYVLLLPGSLPVLNAHYPGMAGAVLDRRCNASKRPAAPTRELAAAAKLAGFDSSFRDVATTPKLATLVEEPQFSCYFPITAID